MKVILWLLQEIGVAKIPSFHRLRKIQKQIKEEGIVPTIQWMSPKGNAYSFNDPRAFIANVSRLNLNISCDLHIEGLVQSLCCKAHPTVPGSSKGWCYLRNLAWNEVAPQHGLPPSKSNVQHWGGRYYFIDEPVRLLDGWLVIPICWLENEEGQVWFDAWEVKELEV